MIMCVRMAQMGLRGHKGAIVKPVLPLNKTCRCAIGSSLLVEMIFALK